jgi:UDP-2-acetamido-3-amino-2,3-dideoxy-glucuronate N-acetyltransferase
MPAYTVHSSSVIDAGAVVGDGTRIWHFCHLMPGARVGKNCNIGQNVFIDNGVNIGDRVKIQNNVSVYNGVSIEDDVFVGPSVVFTNVINPRSFVERKSEFKPTVIGQGSTIGANATIVCGIKTGEYSMIAAGAVVTKNVLPFQVVAGNPASPVGWISKNGHKLQFDETGSSRDADGHAYLLQDGSVRAI